MLDPKSWLDQAQAVPEGKSRRGLHDCGASSLVVYHNADSWSAYCHRCHDSGRVFKPAPSLEERKARKAAQQAADDAIRSSPRLPQPLQFDVPLWPLKARVWLYKAGLSHEDIAQLGAYWHEPSQRVVVPVLGTDGAVLHWQARNVGLSDGPKYLGPRVPAGSVVPQWGSGELLVLCEDLLSTYRVGMATEAWCIMGTTLHDNVARLLLVMNKPVALWLDPDKAGDRAAGQMMKVLTMLAIPHTKISSTKDPKLLSRAEVAQHIAEAATCMGIPS